MRKKNSSANLASSFRDPSGFVFTENGEIYRQVNRVYGQHYDQLMESGLYEALVDSGLLLPHEEVGSEHAVTDEAYKVIKPRRVPFVSYPYEWCFSQLKDAALATLAVQKTAFDFGMTLKDSSAYNIQFLGGKPVLIDTLSFEKYRQGQLWVPYKQFCQHFLAPLALMSYTDIRLSQLFRIYIDGIPADLASSLLPFRTWLRFSLLSHIHLLARSQKRFADSAVDFRTRKMGRLGFQGIIDSLESAVKKLKWRPTGTEWAEYYNNTNYRESAFEEKKKLVSRFLDQANPANVWDVGANTGEFSRLASKRGVPTVSFDIDPAAVEINYLQCKQQRETTILPLVLDLTNPSPSIGWANSERTSLWERGPTDTVLALALIHHLAISNNVPLGHVAECFQRMCNSLIIEFIPKSDSKVQKLLATREDVFPGYTSEGFEREFERWFEIRQAAKIEGSQRTLYLMEKKPQ